MNQAEIYLLLEEEKGKIIQGDVESIGYQGQIALSSWTEINFETKKESAANDYKDSQIKANKLDVKKNFDLSSINLLNFYLTSKTLHKATITLIQRTDQSIIMRTVLSGVHVVSFSFGFDDSNGGFGFGETWGFEFNDIEIIYKGSDENENVDINFGHGNKVLRDSFSNFELKGNLKFQRSKVLTDASDKKNKKQPEGSVFGDGISYKDEIFGGFINYRE